MRQEDHTQGATAPSVGRVVRRLRRGAGTPTLRVVREHPNAQARPVPVALRSLWGPQRRGAHGDLPGVQATLRALDPARLGERGGSVFGAVSAAAPALQRRCPLGTPGHTGAPARRLRAMRTDLHTEEVRRPVLLGSVPCRRTPGQAVMTVGAQV
jgi:hypothetical protein